MSLPPSPGSPGCLGPPADGLQQGTGWRSSIEPAGAGAVVGNEGFHTGGVEGRGSSQPQPMDPAPGDAASPAVAPGQQADVGPGKQEPSAAHPQPSVPAPGAALPAGVGPTATWPRDRAQASPSHPSAWVHRGASSGALQPPPAVFPLVRELLTDPSSGRLLEDARILSCGHSFAGLALEQAQQAGSCPVCHLPLDPSVSIPNLSLCAVAAAFGREAPALESVLREHYDNNLAVLMSNDSFHGHLFPPGTAPSLLRQSSSALLSSPSTSPSPLAPGPPPSPKLSSGPHGSCSSALSFRSGPHQPKQKQAWKPAPGTCGEEVRSRPTSSTSQFPYKVNDIVIIRGNKRTPGHFIGRKAIITTQCLNGWYLVRTLDDAAEEVRLQYRSLERLSGSQGAAASGPAGAIPTPPRSRPGAMQPQGQLQNGMGGFSGALHSQESSGPSGSALPAGPSSWQDPGAARPLAPRLPAPVPGEAQVGSRESSPGHAQLPSAVGSPGAGMGPKLLAGAAGRGKGRGSGGSRAPRNKTKETSPQSVTEARQQIQRPNSAAAVTGAPPGSLVPGPGAMEPRPGLKSGAQLRTHDVSTFALMGLGKVEAQDIQQGHFFSSPPGFHANTSPIFNPLLGTPPRATSLLLSGMPLFLEGVGERVQQPLPLQSALGAASPGPSVRVRLKGVAAQEDGTWGGARDLKRPHSGLVELGDPHVGPNGHALPDQAGMNSEPVCFSAEEEDPGQMRSRDAQQDPGMLSPTQTQPSQDLFAPSSQYSGLLENTTGCLSAEYTGAELLVQPRSGELPLSPGADSAMLRDAVERSRGQQHLRIHDQPMEGQEGFAPTADHQTMEAIRHSRSHYAFPGNRAQVDADSQELEPNIRHLDKRARSENWAEEPGNGSALPFEAAKGRAWSSIATASALQLDAIGSPNEKRGERKVLCAINANSLPR